MSSTDSHGGLQWTGRIITAIVVLLLLADAAAQWVGPAPLLESMKHTGFEPSLGPRLAVVTATCAILLAIPQTAVLGAILVTGFLGGAITAHVRLGEIGSPPQLISLVLGVAAWGGLYLRDARLRALLPFRTA